MHFEISISLATSVVWRTEGDGVVVAERCLISSDSNDDIDGLYALSMVTMNALYSGVCVFASPTNGVSVFAR